MTVPAASGKKALIADGLTVSRGVLSLILLFLPVRAPLFTAVYLLCGVSDVLDGFVARALHTESKRGALLDSTADLIFFAVCAVKIFPRLSLPLWVWGWVIGIAAVKLAVILWDRRPPQNTCEISRSKDIL